MHQLRDAEKLALHRVIAERLIASPDEILAAARANLARWLSMYPDAPEYVEWRRILDTASADEVIELITADNEQGRHLRQCTPFVGILTQEERAKTFADARSHWIAVAEDCRRIEQAAERLNAEAADVLSYQDGFDDADTG